MAVAAYAAVVSLMQVLDQISDMHTLHLDRNQIETLREKVSFLQDFLEVHSQRSFEELEGLARQIAAVSIEADDIIDARVLDQLTTQSGADLTSFWKSDIDNLIEKIDSIQKELMMIKEGTTIHEQRPRESDPTRSSAPPSSGNDSIVGFDEQLERIKDELTRDKRDLQVLPIVGMGGIGKTTLAKTVFDDRYMSQHFDIRTWVSISQDYSMKRILLGLLRSGEKMDNEETKESDESLAELGQQLHKKLYDRRYLVVMDDVWSTEVWNDLCSFFPNNSNGSRILVTTRLSNVAVPFGTSNSCTMDFLDKDKSWELFRKKVFPEDGRCPPELEKIGKSIANSCKGLPLAIVVIAGLLSKSNMTREYWESVAENVNSFANSGDDEHCLKILSLSYNHLPIHLKPCFLHMRVYPEDAQIRIDDLIQSWVAEGFLKPIEDKTLEEVTQEYLDDLIGRSLILTREWTNMGKLNICGIHDLLRDLCIKESHREHFYRVPKVQHLQIGRNRYTCFLCSSIIACTRIDLPQVIVSSQQTSITSRLVCGNCRITYPQLNRLRFAKVLDVDNSDEDILHPTKLRVLSIFRVWAFNFVGNLLHLLWNMQTLIIESRREVCLPSEIWELPQLRHLITRHALPCLLEPPLITRVDRKDSTIILKNLQTLSKIGNFRWSNDAIERIPNLKKLGIAYYDRNKDWSYYSLHSIGRLHKLESLYLRADALLTLKNISFPHSLKELALWMCNIPWEEMTIIGSLPNLEVLELNINAFDGPEWNPIEEEFQQLKELSIWSSNLVRWGAEKIHFPNLELLELEHMKCLEEIPSGIGEIMTLRSIRLCQCKESTVNSAKDIVEEQHGFGNEDLQLFVDRKLVLPSGG